MNFLSYARCAEHLEDMIRAWKGGALDVSLFHPGIAAIEAQLARIGDALPHGTEALPTPADLPDLATLRALLDELDALLNKNDTEAIDIFARNAPTLHAALGPATAELGRLIQQFAFESAHMKLRELRIWSGR